MTATAADALHANLQTSLQLKVPDLHPVCRLHWTQDLGLQVCIISSSIT